MNRGLRAATLICFARAMAGAQTDGARPVFSIGQPSRWTYNASVSAPLRGSEGSTPWAVAGVHRAITNPVGGLLGATGEVYVAPGGSAPGARLLGESKALAISAGVDWNAALGRVSPIVTYESAIR